VHDTETYKTTETIENPDPDAKKGVSYKYENPLILTPVQANQVASWMFLEYDFDAKYTAVWRQNPAFEVGEAVAIEDIYGGKKKVRITKQEFNFAGYLDGITEGKGGV
jgi:beta-galactosidase/beta-glucuronidase